MSAGKESLWQSLRQKARAAFEVDQGPWYYDGRDIFTRDTNAAAAHHLLLPLPETWHASQRVPEAIAEHVAACDPSSILVLLDRNEALEVERNYFLRVEAAARRLADAADRLERNPMANNLPAYRYPVVDAIGAVRNLLEARRERKVSV